MAQLVTVFEKPVKMTVTESWDPMEIREMCIDHDWYNAGSCRDYDTLLTMVQELSPTPANMLRVAQNIANHSKDDEIGSASLEMILYVIANDVVIRTFEF